MTNVRFPLHGPLALLAIALAIPAQGTDWVQLSPTTRPVARQNSAMAHDHVRGVTVLFGGWDDTQRRNDTWEWNGTTWTQINTPVAPSPRDAMTLAYDGLRQVTVCTAGYVAPGQTWEYDGTTWAQIPTATTHALGPHRTMVYDMVRGVCVLFGQSSATSLRETWEYDGVDWTQVVTASVPSRDGNLAYDLFRMRTVYFGDNGETWEYDGSAWTQMSPILSPPGTGCGFENMVYDLARQVVVLWGGCASPATGDTWEYDGVTWTQVTTANAPSFPRRYTTMAYDSTRNRTVLFGGREFSTGPGVLVDDTWEYGLAGTLAANTAYGTACGGLTLSGATRPVIGASWDLVLGNIPTGTALGAMLLGVSNPNLPLGAGAPGCTQYSGDIGQVLLLPPFATPAVTIAIPNDPNLIGLGLSSQGAGLLPGANPLNLVASHGLRGTIGDI